MAHELLMHNLRWKMQLHIARVLRQLTHFQRFHDLLHGYLWPSEKRLVHNLYIICFDLVFDFYKWTILR